MTDLSSLQTKFEQAKAQTAEFTERPDNTTLLKLYGLYKQGSLGDNDQSRPPFSEMVARAKWDTWTALKGLPREQAMRQYIDLIAALD